MASVTHVHDAAGTSNASTYTTTNFTPPNNVLLVVFVVASGTQAAGSLSDSLGGTYTRITFANKNTNVDRLYCFVRDSLIVTGASMNVTFDCTGDAATGAITFVAAVSGMSKAGSAAVLQSAIHGNEGAGTTPEVTFSSSVLTGNPTLALFGNSVNPATITPPTDWTEQADVGYNSPVKGAEYVSRDSGFTGTQILWGSNSSTVWGALAIELDSSSSGTLYTQGIDVTSTFTVALIRAIVLTKAITSTLTVALQRKVNATKAITSAISVALNRSISLTKSFSSTFTVGLSKLLSKSIDIPVTFTVGLLKAYVKDFNVNSTFTVGLQRIISLTKATSSACSVGISRTIRATKSINSTFGVGFTKLLSKSFDIASAFTVGFTAAKAFFVDIIVASTFVVEFNRQLLLNRAIDISSTFVVGIQRFIKLTKNIPSTFTVQVVELFAIIQQFDISSTFTVVFDAIASLFDGFRGSLRRPKGRGRR